MIGIFVKAGVYFDVFGIAKLNLSFLLREEL